MPATNITNLGRVARYCGAVILVLALAVVPGRADTVSFTDGTFTIANYNQVWYTNNTVAAGASYSVTQNNGVGNPAPSLQFEVSWTTNTTFALFDGLINTGFTYNPSTSGAITALAFSLDRYTTFTVGTVVLNNASASALLEQNSNYYIDSVLGPAFSSATWQTVSTTGLTATDFCLYSFSTNTADCTQHPDFSSTGGLIGFGFRTGLGHSNTLGTGTFDTYSDNLAFEINTVPEPSSAYLLLSALMAVPIRLCLQRWRRARHPVVKPNSIPV